MELVIDISEETYNEVCWRGLSLCPRSNEELVKAIKNGTPLPKGHGRLIDADELIKDRVENDNIVILVNTASTIIEADKEYEVEVVTRGNCMICGKELTEGLFFCRHCGKTTRYFSTYNEAEKEWERMEVPE